MITFKIDDIVPCLKDNATGDLINTEVVKVERQSYLKKFNSLSGWHVNWSSLAKNSEIYALVIEGTTDIQGMIAIQYDDAAKAVYVVWGCTAPHNNIWKYGKQKYSGVGGHLFAIASELSCKKGYDGYLYAEAVDKELYNYYLSEFNATPIPLHGCPYRFMLDDDATKKLREVYSYEWTNTIL